MKENLIGKVIGIYTVLYKCEDLYSDGHKKYCIQCNICGKKFFKKLGDIKKAKKCIHMHNSWKNKRVGIIFTHMVGRCYNSKDKAYRWYGGKGIKVCDEWLQNPKSFEDWALNNGYKNNLTIDRKDSNKDYSPENCRWITFEDNSKYKSTTRVIEVDGIKRTGREWAIVLNFGCNIINTLCRKYPENLVKKLIRRRLSNPNLKRKPRQSWMNAYGLE